MKQYVTCRRLQVRIALVKINARKLIKLGNNAPNICQIVTQSVSKLILLMVLFTRCFHFLSYARFGLLYMQLNVIMLHTSSFFYNVIFIGCGQLYHFYAVNFLIFQCSIIIYSSVYIVKAKP